MSETPSPAVAEWTVKALGGLERELAEAQARLEAAQGRVDELRRLRDGFRKAMEMYGTGRGLAE